MTTPLSDEELVRVRADWTSGREQRLLATIDDLKARVETPNGVQVMLVAKWMERAETAERRAAAMRLIIEEAFKTISIGNMPEHLQEIAHDCLTDNAGADFFTEAQMRRAIELATAFDWEVVEERGDVEVEQDYILGEVRGGR